MKLIQLVDNYEYVASNCWQMQLLEHLHAQCDEHVLVNAASIKRGNPIPEGDVYLSTLVLRSAYALRSNIASLMGGRPLHVYDQDPWESYIDGASYKGSYDAIAGAVNVKEFIVTSKWWADFVSTKGLPARFARMWVIPKFCNEGTPWSSRPICVGFKGKLHPYRQKALQELENRAVGVVTIPPGDYSSFLQDLRQMQFFVHAENEWTIDGKPIGNNGSWAKEIEIASQGCFALRRHEPEADAYERPNIPGIVTFKSWDEVPELIESLTARQDVDQLSQASVEFIRNQAGWFKLTDLVE